jgi:hypothetical protein
LSKIRRILIAFAVSALAAVPAYAANYAIYSDAGLGAGVADPGYYSGSSGNCTLTELTDAGGCPFDLNKYYRFVYNGLGYAGWYFSFSGTQNMSLYTNLILYVKGAAGGEKFKVSIKDSNNIETNLIVGGGSYATITTSWQMVKIPLANFTGVNLSAIIMPINFAFVAADGAPAETVYVDYVFWGNDATPPGAPTLQEPADSATTTNQNPFLNWSDVTDDSGVTYQVQVDNSGSAFPSPEIDVSNISPSQYTPATALALGNYWWRVRATDGSGNIGSWSTVSAFTIAAVDATPPLVPSPISPPNGSSSYDTTPALEWSQVTDPSGVTYKIQIDDESSFSVPLSSEIAGVQQNRYSVSPPLAAGKTYYWRVKAIDGAGNQSEYSDYRSFAIMSTAWTSFNVINDQGAAGYVGTYKEPGASLAYGDDYSTYTEGIKSQRADFVITPAQWAGWFVQEGAAGGNATRYMATYSSGYLSFSFKSSADVEIGIRSNNVAEGNEKSKVLLGQGLGVLLNNQWQEVSIPISTFTAMDSDLDLSTMTVYFNAAAVGAKIGAASGSFWIDNVRWMSPGSVSPDMQKVFNGLKNKQNPATGLVRSFESINRAVTYDQALAIMAYCYYGNVAAAQNALNAYKNNIGWAGVGGYGDEYNTDDYTVILGSRTTGTNLWMLQAVMYYRYITGDTTYDTMMNNLAAWLASRQDADGGLKFGYDGSNWLTSKSAEHNLTGYAAFKNYAQITGNSSFNTKADSIKSWLDTMWGYWNGEASRRFKVGSSVASIDKALDCYSLAILAFPSGTYNECLSGVDGYFKDTKTCDLTGVSVEGYDFGAPGGQQPDKDSVWLEGTGQMAAAYCVSGDNTQWSHFTGEVEKAIAPMGDNAQGIAYATNQGTAYGGWMMDSTHQCISSAVWYLFAKNKFNPLYPIPKFQVSIHNRLDDAATNYISWTPPVLPYGWVAADQYLRIDCEPNLSSWGIQIYTDNKAADAAPYRYTGIANPVGLVGYRAGVPAVSSTTLSICWRLTDGTTNSLTIVQGGDNKLYSSQLGGVTSAYPCFLWMKDFSTPAIPATNTTAFVNGEDYVTLKDALRGGQHAEGTWNSMPSPDYVYFGAKFTNAITPGVYKTGKLTVEFFSE